MDARKNLENYNATCALCDAKESLATCAICPVERRRQELVNVIQYQIIVEHERSYGDDRRCDSDVRHVLPSHSRRLIREGCFFCGSTETTTTYEKLGMFGNEGYYEPVVLCAECGREFVGRDYCNDCDCPADECICEEKADALEASTWGL